MENDQAFDTSKQNNARGYPAPRDDEATPVKEIRAQHARTRNVSVDVANAPVLLADVNNGRMGLIVTNNSLQSNLVVVCTDDKPGANSTNEVTSIVPPLGEWRVPAQYAGRIWGYWSVNSTIKRSGSDWAASSSPAAGTMATANRGAVANVSHVLTSFSAMIYTNAAVAGAQQLCVRDGATGVGNIIWIGVMAVPGIADQIDQITINFPTGLIGTRGNALTVEFVQAPGATIAQVISMNGYDTSSLFFGDEIAFVTEFA